MTVAIIAILIAIIAFSLLKGVIKLLLLAAAAVTAIAAWIFVQKNGFTMLDMITNSPQPWMVQALAWLAAIFIFAIFFHGMSWFAQLFSWRRDGATTGGILTTTLMCVLMLWLAFLGISYYGDVSLISFYHDRATTSSDAVPTLPWASRIQAALRNSPLTSWVQKINPMDNPTQTKLACFVAYGCSLSDEQLERFYHTYFEGSGIARPSYLLKLFRDPGLRTLVREKRFVSLLENPFLRTFLQFQDSQQLKNFNSIRSPFSSAHSPASPPPTLYLQQAYVAGNVSPQHGHPAALSV